MQPRSAILRIGPSPLNLQGWDARRQGTAWVPWQGVLHGGSSLFGFLFRRIQYFGPPFSRKSLIALRGVGGGF